MSSDINLLDAHSEKENVFGVDGWIGRKGKRTGVEYYALCLLNAMKKQRADHSDAKERVVLYSPFNTQEMFDPLPPSWSFQRLAWPLSRGWMKARVSLEMLCRPPDLLFVPSQGLPFLPPLTRKGFRGLRDLLKGAHAPVVTTIHDIGFLRHPELYPSTLRRRLGNATRHALRHASHILVPSEFTKRELTTFYRVPQERVTVIPLAPSCFSVASESSTVLEQTYRLGRHFFLFVGRLEKKKNAMTLIHAFELFKKDRGVGDPYELVLGGDAGFGYEEIKRAIEASPVSTSIHVPGYLPEAHVQGLMRMATAVLCPSWYEGFGMPTLEAMRAKTPLIASDIPVHREVAGDAALFALPQEPEQFARNMRRMANDPLLREELVRKGQERLQFFSWEKTAAQTWEVLKNLVYSS